MSKLRVVYKGVTGQLDSDLEEIVGEEYNYGYTNVVIGQRELEWHYISSNIAKEAKKEIKSRFPYIIVKILPDVKNNPKRCEGLIDKMFRTVQMKGYISDALSVAEELKTPVRDKCDNCDKLIMRYTPRPIFGLFCSEKCSQEKRLEDSMELKETREAIKRAKGKENPSPRRFEMYRERPGYYRRSRFNPAPKKLTNAEIVKRWKMFVLDMIAWYEDIGTVEIIDKDRFEKSLLRFILGPEGVQELGTDWLRGSRQIEDHPRKWGARFKEGYGG